MDTALERQVLQNAWRTHVSLQAQLLEDAQWWDTLQAGIAQACEVFRQDGKLLFCGNGGSASDAQHIAAELSGRFYRDRAPLYAEALHVNTSYLTAVANDYGYEETFARMVQACGRKGDVLIAISTSGNSANVLRAAERAKSLGMRVWAWTGEGGGKLKAHADLCFAVPSKDTARIQETHILLGHLLCQGIELQLFPNL